jgi:hypothetical protein
MSSILLTPPNDIQDIQLIFDDDETRQILIFFWPEKSNNINSLSISTGVRRFAQSILIAAIDASYAMGFIDRLFTTITNPRGGLKAMAKKLARSYVKHWWKHTQQIDLQDARIYETVRAAVARNFRTPIEEFVQGVASVHLPNVMLQVARATGPLQSWS